MCKGSLAVGKTADAKANTTLGIGTVKDHGSSPATHGALHKIGETTADCVHCIQTGSKLTLSNIPAGLQKKYDIRAVEVVTFVQTTQWHQDDQVVIERTRMTIDLKEFAHQGVEAFVGEKRGADIDQTVSKVLADAIAGAQNEAPITAGKAPKRRHRQLATTAATLLVAAFVSAGALTAIFS